MIKQILIGILLLGIGVAFGRYIAPSKVIEKEKIIYKDKIVVKKVLVKDQTIHNNKVTIRLITFKPDGTKTIETKTYDKTLIDIVQKDQTKEINDSSGSSEKDKTIEYKKDEYLVSINVKTPINMLSPNYGVSINKRFIGPIYIGAFGFLDKTVGLSLGLAF